MIAIDSANLFRGKIGCNVGKISVAEVVTPLNDVLKDILHIPEISRGNTFATDFIESLPTRCYIFLNSGITLFGEHSGYITGIGDAEAIFPCITSHLSGIVSISIVRRRSHAVAIFTDDFKHR